MLEGGEEVLGQLGPIQLLLHGAAIVVIAGIAAERGQAIRGERHEACLRDPARDVLDIGVEAAIFVHDDNPGVGPAAPAGLTR